jgi:AcrR family transcriptional regulator
MATARRHQEWAGDEPWARRQDLYIRAAPVFRKYGYRGATLKALANACGLSIPALYRYFPSKKAFALFPLRSLHPELHGPPPEVTVGEPITHLVGWIEGAVAEMPYYLLALRLAREVGLRDTEQRKTDTNLSEHIDIISDLAQRAGPFLDRRAARELALTMVNVVLGPALTGVEPAPEGLRRQLRALLRGYGLVLPRSKHPRP